MSGNERTGWRDQRFSALHRELGLNVPMTDIDTLWIEYDQARGIALIDYKRHTVDVDQLLACGDVNLAVIGDMGDRAGVPAFVIRYWDGGAFPEWRFKVYPLNWLAEMFNGLASEVLTMGGYAEFLYRLRNRPTPASVQQRAGRRPHSA